MAAIYDKALKRKDFSGIVDKDAVQKKDPKTISTLFDASFLFLILSVVFTGAASKGDDPKAGADIGKIVNLMAGDANRVCHLRRCGLRYTQRVSPGLPNGLCAIHDLQWYVLSLDLQRRRSLSHLIIQLPSKSSSPVSSSISTSSFLIPSPPCLNPPSQKTPRHLCLRRVCRAHHRLATQQLHRPPCNPDPERCQRRPRQTYGGVERVGRSGEVHQILCVGGEVD